MASQKISNERKKELEQIDPFQRNLLKAMAYAKKHQKQLLLIAGAAVVVVAVFSSILYSFKRAEDQASLLVREALVKYEAAKDPVKGYQDVKPEFEKLFAEYANTTSGRQAKITFAKICFDASEFDQSHAYYKESLDLFKDKALMENFLLVSLGNVSLARNDLEEAKRYFLKVESKDGGVLKDEAMFALALLYEAEGKSADGKKMYEQIVSQYGQSFYSAIAKSKIDQMN